MVRKWFIVAMLLCLATSVLTGCISGSNNDVTGSAQASKLKVMYYSEEYFYQEYGMLFSAMYPDIEIEVVSTDVIYDSLMKQYDQDYTKALEAYIKEEQPDVILVDSPSFVKPLLENGTLLDLDTLIADKDYQAEELIPGVIDYMKEIGSGKVYTIPISFRTEVIYYNKDLFDQFSIPYPTDQMTWSELIGLAKQFPTDGDAKERLFGLSMGSSNQLSEIVYTLANSQGINFLDTETLQMTMNTPAWTSLIEQALDIKESNVLFYDDLMYTDNEFYIASEDSTTNDPFIDKRLAMKIASNHYMGQIEDAQKYAEYPEDVLQQWDMVTAPISPQQPDSTSYTAFYNLAAINANSTNKDAAWKYISYITGDKYARVMSKVRYGNVPIRTTYLAKNTDRNYTALYKLKPLNNHLVSYENVPQIFLFEFSQYLDETLAKLAEGQITIEHAINEMQLKGNELLSTDMMSSEEYDHDKEGN